MIRSRRRHAYGNCVGAVRGDGVIAGNAAAPRTGPARIHGAFPIEEQKWIKAFGMLDVDCAVTGTNWRPGVVVTIPVAACAATTEHGSNHPTAIAFAILIHPEQGVDESRALPNGHRICPLRVTERQHLA